MEEKIIQLAALLHDIGLLKQIIEEDQDHVKISADFVKEMNIGEELEEKVREIILHHHHAVSDLDFLEKIIQKADIDSGEKEKEHKEEHLVSVFSTIRINEGKKTDESFLPLMKLDLENLERLSLEKGEDEHIWDEFEKEANILVEAGKITDFASLLFLLKKYATFAPSTAGRDVSLYEHLRISTALATSLYHFSKDSEIRFGEDEKCYMLIYGDISGIQQFIYQISSPQEAQKGMSKRLRGRSLYISLINDAIATRIVHDLNLTEANILFCGGGHFLIIAQNTESTREKLDRIIKEVNTRFIDRFNAEIYLAISTLPISGADLRNFGALRAQIELENTKQKRKRFDANLEKIFEDEKKVPRDLCHVCGYEREEKEDFCSMCKSHEKLGRKAANAVYLLKVISEENDKFDMHEFNVGYKFLKKEEVKDLATELRDIIEKSDNTMILRLNSSDFLDKTLLKTYKSLEVSFGFSFIANVVPSSSAGILYFEHLAKISKGTDKIGVLKMDVDDLGKIFAKGLGEETNISRVSTLSSFLDLFFLGHINTIAERYNVFELCENCKARIDDDQRKQLTFERRDGSEVTIDVCREDGSYEPCENCTISPTIYITYSGGDDILIVGPYDDIVEFAKSLHQDFKCWTCENTDINISAGIFIAGHKFPIGDAARYADRELEKSKDRKKNRELSCGLAPSDRGKGRMTLFNETLRWDTDGLVKGFNEVFDFALDLEKLVEGGVISKSFVYSLLYLWLDTFLDREVQKGSKKSTREVNDKMKLERKRYVPYFKYGLARSMKKGVNDELLKSEKEDLKEKGVKYMPWIKIPVSWVSLRTR